MPRAKPMHKPDLTANHAKEPFQLISAQDVPDTFFAGYDRELAAGLGFAAQAATNDLCYRLLIFGMPGTGKTSFPTALACRLNAYGLGFHVLMVECDRLVVVSHGAEDVREKLRQIESYVTQQYTPLIVCLDEFDSIAGTRSVSGSPEQAVVTWCMTFLGQKEIPGTLVLCGMNFPNNVDPAVLNRLEHSLYFPMPNKKTAVSLIVHEGIPSGKAQEVINILFDRATTLGSRYSGRALLEGAARVMHYSKDIAALPADKIAAWIRSEAPPTEVGLVTEYDRDNHARIDQSEVFIELWQEKWQLWEQKWRQRANRQGQSKKGAG